MWLYKIAIHEKICFTLLSSLSDIWENYTELIFELTGEACWYEPKLLYSLGIAQFGRILHYALHAVNHIDDHTTTFCTH